ncbi:hypothetical protein C2845_PM10G18650 [Panicum miliaceum]|uniref:Transcription elongation factor 1 homolog n=1 Tax=Panicum miliaceum TaxID=4540 RepID=A0A3L6PB87_PANMI|nr:hypothetical protein C2845_PM10G18650 [Panicum miliaceum]
MRGYGWWSPTGHCRVRVRHEQEQEATTYNQRPGHNLFGRQAKSWEKMAYRQGRSARSASSPMSRLASSYCELRPSRTRNPSGRRRRARRRRRRRRGSWARLSAARSASTPPRAWGSGLTASGRVAEASCWACGAGYSVATGKLTKPIDVYCGWIDERRRVSTRRDHDSDIMMADA